MESRRYPTDLSEDEWRCQRPASSRAHRAGPPQGFHGLRAILDAVFFYVLKSGCPWRLLPRDFPPWRKTVYSTGSGSSGASTVHLREHLNAALRERLRTRLGRRTRTPARASPASPTTRSPRRLPAWVANRGATTEERRRFGAGSATCCSWTPRRAWS